MEYCGPRGIPKSQFLKWSEDDQDAALAWVIDQASRCPRCGSYPEEWFDAEGMPVEPPPMYAHSEMCRGCVTIDSLEETIRATGGERYSLPVGMRVYLSRKPPPSQEDDDSD